jgi:hypothetical protein
MSTPQLFWCWCRDVDSTAVLVLVSRCRLHSCFCRVSDWPRSLWLSCLETLQGCVLFSLIDLALFDKTALTRMATLAFGRMKTIVLAAFLLSAGSFWLSWLNLVSPGHFLRCNACLAFYKFWSRSRRRKFIFCLSCLFQKWEIKNLRKLSWICVNSRNISICNECSEVFHQSTCRQKAPDFSLRRSF